VSGDNERNTRPGGRKKGDLSWNQAIVVGGLAMSVPGLLFGPPVIGYYLDQWLGTAPWLFIAFFVVALIGTAFDVYVILKRIGMLG
jgi:F0F1-type ATP synthase assembly protein I